MMHNLGEKALDAAVKLYQNKTEEIFSELPALINEINNFFMQLADSGEISTSVQLQYVKNIINGLIDGVQSPDILKLADILYFDVASMLGVTEGIAKDTIKLNMTNEGIIRQANSHKNTDIASSFYVDRYNDIPDYSVVFTYGISDGKILQKLVDKYRDNETIDFIFIIPTKEDLEYYNNSAKLQELVDMNDIYVIDASKTVDGLLLNIQQFATEFNWQLQLFLILPNYDLNDSRKCEKIIDDIILSERRALMNSATTVVFGESIEKNILKNLKRIVSGYAVDQLKDPFKEATDEGAAAILVSAGPSLDKNIKYLKEVNDRAFIIVVDSALNKMAAEDVPFHMTITIDSKKPLRLFESKKIKDKPMAVSFASRAGALDEHRGKLFFETAIGGEYYDDIIKEKTKKSYMFLGSGGSVANDAFDLLVAMGFRKIILVGQDLAFTDGRKHAQGFDKSEKDNKDMTGRHIVNVEGYYGGTIETDIQMDVYREWFEHFLEIPDYNITLINATEGGAKIKGSHQMTLKEAIDKYCIKQYDFNGMIENIAPYFSKQEQKELLDRFSCIPHDLDKLIDKLKRADTTYDRFIELENRKDYGKEYKKLLKDIEKINRIEGEDPVMKSVRMYIETEQAKAVENLYTEDLTTLETAKRGQALIQTYIKGAGLMKQNFEEYASL